MTPTTLDMIGEAVSLFLRRHHRQLPLPAPQDALALDLVMEIEEPGLYDTLADLDDNDVEYIYGYVRSRGIIRALRD